MADPTDEAAAELIELRSNLSRIFEEIRDTRRTTAGVTVSPETALECSAVLACVRVLSESIASMPFGVYRRLPNGGKEVADGEHLHEIIAYQPNSWMTSFEFRELMQSWILLWGNAYAYIKPSSRRGAVDELIPLHPSRMECKRLSNGKLRYYYTEPPSLANPLPGEPKEYRQDEIFHLRWLSSDGVTGYVPTTLSREAIGLARATEMHSSAFFGNGAKAGTYIETAAPQKPESLARFKAQWDEAHRGPDKAFKTVIMPHGFTKKEDPVRNDTAQLIETMRWSLESIARNYRVPPHMIGDLTNVRYSTAEQSSIDFITFSLIPWCRRWEMACRRDLVVDDKNFFCAFDTNSLLVGDFQARAQFLREAFNNAAIDIDEYRAAIGYNPLPNDEGKKRFIQVNMQLLSQFTPENPTGKSELPPAAPVDDAQPAEGVAPAGTSLRSAEVVFRTALRRLASIEADGILDRRNKPDKIGQWIDQTCDRMVEELRDAAEATGRDIEKFAAEWSEKSRDLLLDCHRSGQKYETVTENWCERHQI